MARLLGIIVAIIALHAADLSSAAASCTASGATKSLCLARQAAQEAAHAERNAALEAATAKRFAAFARTVQTMAEARAAAQLAAEAGRKAKAAAAATARAKRKALSHAEKYRAFGAGIADDSEIREVLNAVQKAVVTAEASAKTARAAAAEASMRVATREAAEALATVPPLSDQDIADALAAGAPRTHGLTIGATGVIQASRTFLGPHHFPPTEYAAYGIVAFPSLGTAETRGRYVQVCQAYVGALPVPTDLSMSESEQMVTVWPVDSNELANQLSLKLGVTACDKAVDKYHLATALYAIEDARLGGATFGNKRGPFLLAWSPSSSKGKEHVPVLFADLSSAGTQEEFNVRFRKWRDDIEQNPNLWGHGWDMAKLAMIIREWADTIGPSILNVSH